MNRQLLIRTPEQVKEALVRLKVARIDDCAPGWIDRIIHDAYVLGIIDTVAGEKTGTAEYLRRNEIVAKAIGAKEALRSAITKGCFVRRFPKWCDRLMREAHGRMNDIVAALVAWRDIAA